MSARESYTNFLQECKNNSRTEKESIEDLKNNQLQNLGPRSGVCRGVWGWGPDDQTQSKTTVYRVTLALYEYFSSGCTLFKNIVRDTRTVEEWGLGGGRADGQTDKQTINRIPTPHPSDHMIFKSSRELFLRKNQKEKSHSFMLLMQQYHYLHKLELVDFLKRIYAAADPFRQ